MTPITLRDATSDDMPGIVQVYLHAYAQPPWNERNEAGPSEDYLRWLMRVPATYFVLAVDCQPPTRLAGLAEVVEAAPAPSILGFVVAGARGYADFVEDWERNAVPPPEGWPAVPGRLGYVWELAVHPQAQRRGVGKALLGEAISRLRRADLDRVLLRSSERAEAAMALYRYYGFERLPVIERRDPLAGPWALTLR